MSITYRRAPTFSIGQGISAASHSLLADAFNDHLINGVGDCTRRIHMYVMYNYRQVRNPQVVSEDPPILNYPSLFEWSAFYQMIDYDELGGPTWPISDAGTEEGANVANPAMSQIFGTEMMGGNTQGEGITFSKFDIMDPVFGGTPEGYWELGKYQRGGYDSSTGNTYAPMLECAESHSMHVFPNYVKHHKGYGGYLPVPRNNDGCKCVDDNGTWYYNWMYKWTMINPPYTVVEFEGSCYPAWSECDATNNVAYIYNGPYAWHVYTYGGAIYNFPKDEWIEGPYDGGGSLQRKDGDQINRLMLNPYIAEYRGIEAQRIDNCYDIRKVAFDNDAFFKGQYLLSPAYATTVGDNLSIVYPSYTFGPATFIAANTVTSVHTVPTNYTCGGVMIKPTKLTGTTFLLQLSGSEIIRRTELSQSVHSYCYNFTTESINSIQFKLESDANFSDGTGNIYIESSDIWRYKPNIEDAYALIRLSSAQATNEDTMDNRGIDCSLSKNIYLNYISNSCAINLYGAVDVWQTEAIANTNPLLDASRRYVNEFTRVINGHDMQLPDRNLVVGYEVSASKSILYLKRYHSAVGLESNNIDMFKGIVHPTDTTLNGIYELAPTGSYSNEWLMFMNTKVYRNSESSIFKPSVYANYFPYVNRCHFMPDYRVATSNPTIFKFAIETRPDWSPTYQRMWLNPDTLTAYNYDGTLNSVSSFYDEQPQAAIDFYKSCEIYPKDYKVESATVLNEGGEEVVKLVFNRRFQHCDNAPASIARNPNTWDKYALRDETYRTDENAIREYIMLDYDAWQPRKKLGDREVGNDDAMMPESNVWGAVYPTFFFTKMIPKPYVPLPATCSCTNYQGPTISIDRFMQMETYLKGMCEGFIDDVTSIAYACNTDFNTAYDYTYENLIYDASGGTHNSIPLLSTAHRSDKVRSFGPLANLEIDAQPLNILSAAINKLYKARLIIPWYLEVKYDSYVGAEEKAANITTTGCSEQNKSWGIFTSYAGPAATTKIGESDWGYASGFDAQVGLGWQYSGEDPCRYGDCSEAGNWIMQTTRVIANYRFKLTDPLAYNAMSIDIQQLLNTAGGAGFYGTYRDQSTYYSVEHYTPPLDEYGSPIWDESTYCVYDGTCSPQYVLGDGTGYKWIDHSTKIEGCRFYTSGQLDAGATSPGGDCAAGVSDCLGYAWSCYNGECGPVPSRNIAIGVKNTKDLMLVVPLV